MKAIILAAGYATRLYPLTRSTPKALLDVGGKSMLSRLMAEIETVSEIDSVHIVTNHKFFDAFEEWRKGYSGLPVTVWDDGTTDNSNRLGAIGDVQFVLDRAKIDDDIMVAASDNLFNFKLADMAGFYRSHGFDTLLGKRIENRDDLRRFAVAELDEEGRVTSLVEKPERPASDIGIFAIYIYRRETVPLIAKYLSEGNNPDAPGHFPEWLYTRREVRAYLFEGECVDIGTVEAYKEACDNWRT